MKCKKCGLPLYKMPEDVQKGLGWKCTNSECELYDIEQYNLNEIEEEDESV